MSSDEGSQGTHSEVVVLINFQERTVLVVGAQYSGETKKAIFSFMNYLLLLEDHVLTMHCSCNMSPLSHDTTVFLVCPGRARPRSPQPRDACSSGTTSMAGAMTRSST